MLFPYKDDNPRVLFPYITYTLITTNTPGCKEVVQDNFNGLVVNIKDQIDLAQKMYELSISANRRLEMGQNSRKLVESEYDVKIVNNKTIELYNS